MQQSPTDIRQYYKDLKKRRSSKEGKLKVAGYIRLSTQAQKDRGYYKEQSVAITEFLLTHLGEFVEPVKVYEDVDVKKAELDPTKRPGLMKALNSGIEKLVAMNISRFGDETNIRQLVDLADSIGVGLITLEHITHFEGIKRKVGFLLPGEFIDSQFDKEGFIARANGLRLQDITRKEKTQRDRTAKMSATRGEGLGIGGKPYYGYDWDRKNATFSLNKKTIKIVREIFRCYVFKRMSLEQIAHKLEDRNISSPKGSNKWHQPTVSLILQRPVYRGLTTDNGLEYPPAIDPFTWERAQYKRLKGSHPLSNLVWCKCCNKKMVLKGDNFYCTECRNKVNKGVLLKAVWKFVKKDIDNKLDAISRIKTIEYAGAIKERIGIRNYGKELIIKNWIPVELSKKIWVNDNKVSIVPLTQREFIKVISPRWK